MKVCPYHEYYVSQAGSGAGVIYRGAIYQRGHGIGSFLGGLFRTIMPLLRSGAKTVGKEILKSSAGFLGDLAANAPIKESLRNRLVDAGNNLKRKAENKINEMGGSGVIKRRRLVKNKQKLSVHSGVTSGKKKKTTLRREADIFD